MKLKLFQQHKPKYFSIPQKALLIKPDSGAYIGCVLENAKKLAKKKKCVVLFKFNETEIIVKGDSNLDEICIDYNRRREEDQRSHK
jgi:hypothetical protein